MKRLVSILVAAVVLTAVSGCYFNFSNSSGWSDSNLKAVTNVVQSAAIPAGLKNLDVINAFGAIHITGGANGPFGWSQQLNVHARTDADVQQLASNLLCRADLAGDRLTLVVTVPDARGSQSFQSDLEITVPKSVAVQTHDQYGRTEINGLDGDVDAADKFGALELRDLRGKVHAETSYAALTIDGTGPATLKNQFGAIDAANVQGPLDAETSYAALDARDIAGTVDLRNQFGRVAAESITGSVRAETSYGAMGITGPGGSFICDNQFGSISVRATSPALTNLEARTSYAALEVRLPAGLKPALQAHTSYADIKSDFPVLMKPRGQDPFAGLPPGTPRINLQNQNGKIRVIGE